MSLFRWFSRSPRPASGPDAAAIQDDAVARAPRSERSARREQLYGMVREAMVRVGILSAGYKFKALSLDSAGQRFVVMVDLAPAYAADAAQQRNIEALIAELARTRLGVSVHAVYWRVNGQIHAAPAQPQQRSMPADWAAAHAQTRPVAAAPAGSGFEPIDAQEMDAFKQAVASAGHSSRPAPLRSGRGPLLGPGSGAEEGGDFAVSGLGSLGATQYGELR
ncbi:hypothetical protein DZC30_22470 [Comamonas testosteroni]|uniref:Uncharacterized protein n=1 Tax=Comamonas testosteroni TaxID=285 RepID=A0A373F4K4_COMTE|nr:hypothetical protein [Comamonas testosteroni]RGE38502.1 hypothetical protein DZC30_22470 [Comamonas testosteroni]